ncbi:MAG: hypothetical protein AAB373_03800 [Patescibacteria group bacterium]
MEKSLDQRELEFDKVDQVFDYFRNTLPENLYKRFFRTQNSYQVLKEYCRCKQKLEGHHLVCIKHFLQGIIHSLRQVHCHEINPDELTRSEENEFLDFLQRFIDEARVSEKNIFERMYDFAGRSFTSDMARVLSDQDASYKIDDVPASHVEIEISEAIRLRIAGAGRSEVIRALPREIIGDWERVADVIDAVMAHGKKK